MTDSVSVRTGARLHFGLLPWPRENGCRHAGVGLMLQSPQLQLKISPAAADEFVISTAEQRDKLAAFLARYRQTAAQGERTDQLAAVQRRLRLEVVEGLPLHAGLGAGTQLGLAVAAGLFAHCGCELPAAEELALAVGRGLRSAVGTHGFTHGGLIFDAGKSGEQTLGTLHTRIELPQTWRVALFTPLEFPGFSGKAEVKAFRKLPPQPPGRMQEIWDLATNRLLPAARAGDFRAFSETLYDYGVQAGRLFAAVQHSEFGNPVTADLVRRVREFGVIGCGQTSWGPTVFAFCEHEQQATELVASIGQAPMAGKLLTHIAKIANTGCTVIRL